MKVFDVWNYNGEPIATARIEYLQDVVDTFIIVEGTHTFTGKPKGSLYFDTAPFRNHPKVRFVKVADVVPGGAWANEAHQRNAPVGLLLSLMGKDDVAICSDADEIPHAGKMALAAARSAAFGGGCLLEQDFYYYNFNWKNPTPWRNALALRKEAVAQYGIQQLRGRLPVGLHSGWHCSYAESKDNIRRKIESFSHTECDLPQWKTEEHLIRCLEQGEDLFGRKEQGWAAAESSALPEALQRFNQEIRAAQGLQ